MSAANVTVEIEGHALALSNLPKVLYPAAGFTKAQVIDYYTRIAPVLLPHLQGRPLTLKRYPNGVDASFFYEKNCPGHRPDWVHTLRVASESSTGGRIDYCVVDNLATLVWVANLASLELHTNLAVGPDVDTPQSVVFDLDPGPPAGLVECSRVAMLLRGLFDHAGLECVVKTSGSKGMQVYVPLNTPVTYEGTKTFARTVAQMLEQKREAGVVSSMKKSLRGGKVLVDWSQNDRHKTTVSVYSLRARPQPIVSTPVTWEEVSNTADGDADGLVFDAPAALERISTHGDLFGPMTALEQELPEIARAM
jgi:bifunctional non-homologous end joining protein LigD